MRRMSQADEDVHPDSPGKAIVRIERAPGADDWADLRPVVYWARRRIVLLSAIVMAAAQIAWRAQFLSRMFFFREDFLNLDLAKAAPLTWSYLTYIGTGHLMIGERAIIWIVARAGLYNWTLAAGISLAFLAATDLAAFRLLSTLFGERPAILLPFAVYLLTPLTIADLGWWTAALESVPLQLAIFLALNAHVHYIRNHGAWHLASAIAWVAFGLLFFEKALALPLLLFGVTSAYLAEGGSWLSSARRVFVRFWPAWGLYATLVGIYTVLLVVALRTSSTTLQAPKAMADIVTFAWNLVVKTLLPGAIGGPWQWIPLPGGWYALTAIPSGLVWLPAVTAIAVVAASLVLRWTAWRAWAILLMWVTVADILPVVISRLSWYPILLALDSRYVADAVPILTICVGLAFFPLSAPSVGDAAQAASDAVEQRPAGRHVLSAMGEQRWRAAATALFVVFVAGSIGSSQAYANVTTGGQAAAFVGNATLAIKLAPRGTPVVDSGLPPDVTFFGGNASASGVVGAIAPGRLRWIGQPRGTFDRLWIFGTDGRLHLAQMYGMGSPVRQAGHNCWFARSGQVAVPFFAATPEGTRLLRFGYLWTSTSPVVVNVRYGSSVKTVEIEPGLHGAYLPEFGTATSVVISGFGATRLCVGDAEAGILVPSAAGPTIPAIGPVRSSAGTALSWLLDPGKNRQQVPGCNLTQPRQAQHRAAPPRIVPWARVDHLDIAARSQHPQSWPDVNGIESGADAVLG